MKYRKDKRETLFQHSRGKVVKCPVVALAASIAIIGPVRARANSVDRYELLLRRDVAIRGNPSPSTPPPPLTVVYYRRCACVSYIVDIYYLRESYSSHSREKKKARSLARSSAPARLYTIPASVRKVAEEAVSGEKKRRPADTHRRRKFVAISIITDRPEEKRASRFAWSSNISKARLRKMRDSTRTPIRSFITRQSIILRSALACYTNGKLQDPHIRTRCVCNKAVVLTWGCIHFVYRNLLIPFLASDLLSRLI